MNQLLRTALVTALLGSPATAAGVLDAYADPFITQDWVFKKYEYSNLLQSSVDKSEGLRYRLRLITDISKALTGRGYHVLLAPVPSRLHVYPETLPADLLQAYRTGGPTAYSYVVKQLRAQGIEVVDLLNGLKASEYYRNKTQMFYRLESHWNAYGSLAAARAIAAQVRPRLDRTRSPRVAYKFSFTTLSERPVTGFRKELSKALQATVPLDQERSYKLAGGSKGLLDEPKIGVALVGSSFTDYGLLPALESELQADVLKMNRSGEGIFSPMRHFLNSEAFKKGGLQTIIWEVPEHIVTTYPPPSAEENAVFEKVLGIDTTR